MCNALYFLFFNSIYDLLIDFMFSDFYVQLKNIELREWLDFFPFKSSELSLSLLNF